MSQLTDLVLHVSWWVAAMLALAGAGIWYAGNRRLDKTLQRLGIAVFLLAIVLAVLHAIFPSQREQMEKRTRQIVSAIDRKDWNALASLLDPNTALGTASAAIESGRDAIVQRTKTVCESKGVKSLWIAGIQSQQTDTLITVSVDVISNQDATLDRPIASSVQLDFEQDGDRWVLQKITILRIADQSDPSLNLLR
jgi:hypothetical protein